MLNMKKKSIISSLLLVGALLLNPITSEAKQFTDLNENGSHNEAVNYLNDLNAYRYVDGNKLNGNQYVTREIASTVLYNLYSKKLESKRSYNNEFIDLEETYFAYEIRWAYDRGIFDGATSTTFNPTKNLTRAQMAKVLVNTFNLKKKGETTFKDVDKKHWSYEYISILESNGITTGNEKGEYKPNSYLTLNQLSTFLYRTIQHKETELREASLGEPRKYTQSLESEYGFKWNVIKTGANLELEGVRDNKVVARYKTEVGSSIDLAPEIKIGVHTKADVEKILGKAVENVRIESGGLAYIGDRRHSMYLAGNFYMTIFFDTLENDYVSGILVTHIEDEIKSIDRTRDLNILNKSVNSSEELMVLLIN